jgi:hypothetical protein
MKIHLGPYVDDGERIEEIHIDEYDTWSMDNTLALIALPMLKQLRKTKHGAPNVDYEDVPESLRPDWDWVRSHGKGETDPHFFDRWDWVMDEMIFSMENIVNDDWESTYWEVNPEIDWDAMDENVDEDGSSTVIWKKEGVLDREGYYKHHDRIDNGCRLFGKYFRNLWD